MEFFERFLAHLQSCYPDTARAVDLRTRLSPLLFCPEIVRLPKNYSEQALAIVRSFWALRSLATRDQELSAREPKVIDPGNQSVLMSYDFHVDAQGRLRLIEINTNASMSLMTELLYQVQGVRNSYVSDFSAEILGCFLEESRQSLGRQPELIAITDENPEQQRLFPEFAMYRELFERSGYRTRIADAKEFSYAKGELSLRGEKIDLVYNRHTDFYFESNETSALREAMLGRAACITPHPHEYRLLADKERLLELSRPQALDALSQADREIIQKCLIRTLDVHEFSDPNQLWSERKHWFFKPRRSFGGKAAYRGSSIGHPVFAQILAGAYLAQEFVPAPTLKIPAGEFKYDLRFFVYRDRVQLACARLYQGQMTNSQTPGGGVAAIDWN